MTTVGIVMFVSLLFAIVVSWIDTELARKIVLINVAAGLILISALVVSIVKEWKS